MDGGHLVISSEVLEFRAATAAPTPLFLPPFRSVSFPAPLPQITHPPTHHHHHRRLSDVLESRAALAERDLQLRAARAELGEAVRDRSALRSTLAQVSAGWGRGTCARVGVLCDSECAGMDEV